MTSLAQNIKLQADCNNSKQSTLYFFSISMLTDPTNQENWPNVFPYMALYWANVLAIVPTWGQFSWFVGEAL